jgi:hypothetical protein
MSDGDGLKQQVSKQAELDRFNAIIDRCTTLSEGCIDFLEDEINKPGVKRGEVESISLTLTKLGGFYIRQRADLLRTTRGDDDDADDDADRVADPGLAEAARKLAAGLAPPEVRRTAGDA